MQKKSLIGAHVSIAGGFDTAITRGEKIGANCIQIFTKSNRQWRAKDITDQQALSFIQQQKSSDIQIVVAHASYLINLNSSNPDTAKKSADALVEEILRCEKLQIPYLVLHPGTYERDNLEQSLIRVAHQINKVFKVAQPKHTRLLLETMAGQGLTIGKTLEELGLILQHVENKKHIGVCVDTCHIFASGYSFDTPTSYKSFWKQVDTILGINKVFAIHINDSKKELGSCTDRHENIGKGKIKPAAFKLLMQDRKLKDIPKILETPKGKDEFADDIKNVRILQSYCKK